MQGLNLQNFDLARSVAPGNKQIVTQAQLDAFEAFEALLIHFYVRCERQFSANKARSRTAVTLIQGS